MCRNKEADAQKRDIMSEVAEQPQPEKENIVGPGRNIEDIKVAELKHWLNIVGDTTNEKS